MRKTADSKVLRHVRLLSAAAPLLPAVMTRRAWRETAATKNSSYAIYIQDSAVQTTLDRMEVLELE